MNEATKAILEIGNDDARAIEDLQTALAKATDEQGRRMPLEISDLIPLVPEIAAMICKRSREDEDCGGLGFELDGPEDNLYERKA